ncbi:LysR family transcriptional regulator [Erwiniaceae bacterium BAC15a-03b]|uniref:LysR family transcriptional regulator n=1 Tax=Winslowiella arboricola TaxID=2978220 RepID=A0A9J6PQ61_9GAMM|nr:LysR family transcriptional regulator [Winslowiella arboricola]MCU5775580.1 LysR family transcriptional regulator [Winslowiella arboricola]MCU5779570.1 LysR family transcriptional regulator [Winslowiella arboricola]
MHSSEIRYFLAVVNTGSLSAASEQLFVAVSAISRQIQRLETRIGVPLFERHARGMILNEAGQIFENHVRKSLMDMEHAMAEIKGLNAVRRTLIRVACTDGMAFYLLPSLFAGFRQLNPAVTFSLRVLSGKQVAEAVRDGDCDVAFQFSLHPERGVEVISSYAAPVLMVMKNDHPLAGQQVTLNDLSHYPLALPEPGTTVRQLFDLACRMNGTFIEPVLTCNFFSSHYNFLLHSPQAITLCSHFTVMYQAQEQGLMLKTFGVDQLTQRSLQIQAPPGRQRSAALNLFLQFASEQMQLQSEQVRQVFGF